VENLSAGIAPVQYVIAVPSNRGSGCPRHGKGPRQEAVAPTASYFTQTTWRTTSIPFGSYYGRALRAFERGDSAGDGRGVSFSRAYCCA
jgi:hypothetical protein